MDINSINFGKRIRSEKNERKNKKSFAPVSSENKKDKTSLEKLRSQAWAAYAAALLAGGPLMTSCVEQTQTTDISLDMEEFKKMFQNLLEIQNQILEQLQQNNNDNKEIIDQLNKINGVLGDINSGVIDINTGLNDITKLIKDSHNFDQEFLSKIDEIIAGQASDSEKLQQILEENQKQNAFLVNIQPYIESIANTNQQTADKLNEFYEAYLAGEITHSEFMQKLLDAATENNNISSDILAEIKKLENSFNQGNIEEAELLQKIADLLASIDGKMDTVIETLNKINCNILDAYKMIDANHMETIDKLTEIGSKIDNGFAINQSQMEELIQLNREGNKNTTDMLVKMDELKDILVQIRDDEGNMRLEELITKYGDLIDGRFQEVLDKMDQDVNINDDDLNTLIAAINNSKNDLSKLQEQLGTIILLLQGAQNAGISPEDLQVIVEAINNLQASNEAGNVEVNKNLSQILEDLSNIEGMLDVMVQTQGQILSTMEKYGNAAEIALSELSSGMQQLIAGQITSEELDEMLEDFRTSANQSLMNQGQAIQLLQAILNSQGADESGMTKEELEEVINNSEVFNKIAGLLEDLNVDRVTNETLNQAFMNNRTDLSKIQEQLGTVIVLLGNLEVGDVTVDTSKLETTINDLMSVIENQGITSNTAMQDISQKLQQVIDSLNEETPVDPSQRMVRYAQNTDTINFMDAYRTMIAAQNYQA